MHQRQFTVLLSVIASLALLCAAPAAIADPSSATSPPESQATSATEKQLQGPLFDIADLFATGSFAEVEALAAELLEEHHPLSQHERSLLWQWRLLARVHPLSDLEPDFQQVAARLRDQHLLQDPPLWNLSLRLLVRQAAAAEPADRFLLWQQGLADLASSASHVRLEDAALADIDRLLAREDAEDGKLRLQFLNGMLDIAPNVASIAALLSRRAQVHADAGNSAAAAADAWLVLAIDFAAGQPLTPSLERYNSFLPKRADRAPLPARPAVSTLSSVGESAASRRTDAEQSARRRAWRAVLRGTSPEIPNPLTTGGRDASTGSQLEAWGEAATLAAIAKGDLLAATEAVLSATAAHRLEDTTLEPVARKNAAIAATVLEDALNHRLSQASDALDRGRDDLAYVLWVDGMRIAAAVDSSSHDRVVEQIASRLRPLPDSQRSLALLTQLAAASPEPVASARFQYARALVLYEQAELEEALAVLADAAEVLQEVWEDSDRLAAGLITAVGQLQLRQIEAAEETLLKLEHLLGSSEQMAQMNFLRGWIHLNRNDPSEAMVHFRRIADEYPATTYAPKAHAMIDRLELATRN